MPGNGVPVVGSGESGSGYRIGDDYVLTAGHVIYQWTNFGHFPANIDGAGVNIALDFRGYKSEVVGLVGGWQSIWPLTYSDGTGLTFHDIEGHPDLAGRDSVLIKDGHDNIGPGDDGLVLFLDPQDLVKTTSSDWFGSSTSVIRADQGTPNIGEILNINPTVAATHTSLPNLPWVIPGGLSLVGTFRFDSVSISGDSGGAYLLRMENREFVIGTHFANLGSNKALGTFFSKDEWHALNGVIKGTFTGDVTNNEPTNLVIGNSINVDIFTGSFRPDIILGRGGNDTLNDGDALGTAVWAQDQIFGGDGADVITAGRGSDLLHGGDSRAYGGFRSSLETDGIDRLSYSDFDSGSGVTISITNAPADATFATTADIANAIFVKDLDQPTEIDTVISVEKLTATAKTDTVEISHLSDGLLGDESLLGGGGLVEINLSDNPSGEDQGDLIDASGMTQEVKIDLSTGRVELKADATIGLKIVDAERATGGKGNDELIAGSAKYQLKGHDGNDLLTATSGASELRVEGGKGNDVIDLRQVGTDDSTVVFNYGDGRDTISYDPNLLAQDGIESVKLDFNIGDVTFVVEIEKYEIQEGDEEFSWYHIVQGRLAITSNISTDSLYVGMVSLSKGSTERVQHYQNGMGLETCSAISPSYSKIRQHSHLNRSLFPP